MRDQRFLQILMIAGALWASWLLMMLVHEGGHVLGALLTGGHVQRVVWHPMALSRTDVDPNPHPLIEVWAGPVFGCVAPLVVATFGSALKLRPASLLWFFAGFCLIANGAYLGVGAVDPVGDARVLHLHGVAAGTLAVFGVATVLPGFAIWHLVSPRLGMGTVPRPIAAAHAYAVFIVAVLLTVIGFTYGVRM